MRRSARQIRHWSASTLRLFSESLTIVEDDGKSFQIHSAYMKPQIYSNDAADRCGVSVVTTTILDLVEDQELACMPIYVCAPFNGSNPEYISHNIKRATAVGAALLELCPSAPILVPHLMAPMFSFAAGGVETPDQRQAAMRQARAWMELGSIRLVVVAPASGVLSPGMVEEIQHYLIGRHVLVCRIVVIRPDHVVAIRRMAEELRSDDGADGEPG